MPSIRRLVALVALFALITPVVSSDAELVSADPAARGLDFFLHVPTEVAAGATLPVQIEAFGFLSATALAPLGGASIEVGWDPEHLGAAVSEAPPTVRATADSLGRATVAVPVPLGAPRDLALLVVLRSGGHLRTRSTAVHRGPRRAVTLYVADHDVVPGSSISAWVAVRSAVTGAPAANTRVDLELLEGGVARETQHVTTDVAGTAMARVAIPYTEEPGWSWTLRARSDDEGDGSGARDEVVLKPREETPATPRMRIFFDQGALHAGDHGSFEVRVRDAADKPVSGLPVRYWVGPSGTQPPASDEAWEKATRGVTDAEGAFHAGFDAPTLVAPGAGATVQIVARASVEGHALSESSTISVAAAASSAEITPEKGAVIAGVSQRLVLEVFDGRGGRVAGGFEVKGDGLDARVTTDADGRAEFTWDAPVDLGALRGSMECGGGVAASVRVAPIGSIAALADRKNPFELCVKVDRDARAAVEVEPSLSRMGRPVHVRVIEPKSRDAAKAGPVHAYSVVLASPDGSRTTSVWMEDPERGVDVVVPDGLPGVWSVSAVAPSTGRPARVLGGAVTVLPRVMPRLEGRVVGGRAAPGGTVDVAVDLTDEQRRGLPGTVAALVVDLRGGGSTGGLGAIDTRTAVCGAVNLSGSDCDRFLAGDPLLQAVARGVASERAKAPLAPNVDPGGSARAALNATFGQVLKSLEGAVYEASASPERIIDVRRKGPSGFTWNPELMTLVTAAMPEPPVTPGGEAISLADLLAVDPQVTFDHVARRVTRLKLFRVLQAVRTFRRDHNLDPDEPVFKDPNAILRRLVRDGALTDDALLDPWGGTLQFVRVSGPTVPFLSVARGFELHSPGPDGRAGDGDDVRDPFERVLKSGTPYADATGEDRVVDARFELEVSDDTVNNWGSVLENFTGQHLGNGSGSGGLGFSGVGTGGGGHGYGIGHGSLSGVRRTAGFATGVAWWSPPTRTDANGHAVFQVPLGDVETTWRIAFVGVPDGAPRATGWVDVPVSLPLSASVEAGVRWIEGDRALVPVSLRNRTAQPIRASVTLGASGVAALDPGPTTQTVDVPPQGVAEVRFGVSARSAGDAMIDVTLKASGLPDDVLHHGFRVVAAGEPTDLTRAEWVEQKTKLRAAIGDRALDDAQVKSSVRFAGAPRVVLERGADAAIAAALDALDPDKLATPDALVEAIDVAARVRAFAIRRDGDGSALAARAAHVGSIAQGRFGAFPTFPERWALDARVHALIPSDKHKAACPPSDVRSQSLAAALEAEPPPEGGAALACWDALVTSAVEEATNGKSAVSLARAYLALVDRPHRADLASTLIDRLRERVALRPSGAIALGDAEAKDRASRAIVYAALLRGAKGGASSAAPAERLLAWIFVQRDADGGYGSALATREVVRALLAAGIESQGKSRVIVGSGDQRAELDVGSNDRVVVPLPSDAVDATVEVTGPGVLARLERPVIRLWSGPPPAVDSPLHLSLTWPSDAHANRKSVVSLSVRHTLGRPVTAEVRVPLPPGATLAEPVSGVRQIQGALAVRVELDGSDLPKQLDLPVRFALSGRFTVPEARATLARQEVARALATARPFVVAAE